MFLGKVPSLSHLCSGACHFLHHSDIMSMQVAIPAGFLVQGLAHNLTLSVATIIIALPQEKSGLGWKHTVPSSFGPLFVCCVNLNKSPNALSIKIGVLASVRLEYVVLVLLKRVSKTWSFIKIDICSPFWRPRSQGSRYQHLLRPDSCF